MKTPGFKPAHKTAHAGLIAGVLLAGAAQAVTINVNTVNDVIADDGSCSLREGIIAANTNTASGALAGECAAGSAGLDEIIIPAGVYKLDRVANPPESAVPVQVDANNWKVGEYLATWVTSTYVVTAPTPNAAVGDLDITESVNIVGAGPDLTIIDGGWTPVPWDVMAAGFDPKADPVDDVTSDPFGDRVFHIISNVTGNVDVQMSGLTVKGGKLETVGGLQAPPAPAGDAIIYSLRRKGGGLAVGVAAGTFDPAVSGSEDHGGGGGSQGGGEGEETGPTYTLALSSMAIMSNYAGEGGGLYNAATATASNIAVSGNRGGGNGGGIYNDAAMTLTNSTVSGNSAEGGGGMFDTGSHITRITGTTISGNGAVGGGGISGRAMVTINMINSTVSGNYGFDVGGGIHTNGTVNLIHATIANNVSNADAPGAGAGINTFASSSVVTLRNTLLANNLVGSDPSARMPANCGGTGGTMNITSSGAGLGYNLSSDSSCLLAGPGDMQSVDPRMLGLRGNGGPTQTDALDATSPAINAALPVAGVTTDQRGVARDSTPDIGAYEYAAAASTSDSGNDGGCLFTAYRGGGPIDPTLPAVALGAALWLMLSHAGRIRPRRNEY
jgi:hypothetical protein